MPVDSPSWDYSGNLTDDNGALRCPGCPIRNLIPSIPCVHGSVQQTICVPYVQAGNALAIFRAQNFAAIATHGSGSPLFPSQYYPGDAEAHDPAGRPYFGDTTYVGPYEE